MRTRFVVSGLLTVCCVALSTVAAHAGNTCPAADPGDAQPDSTALQDCLDAGGIIELTPGTPGYIIDEGLVLSQSYSTLTSSIEGVRATLVAAPGLFEPMLEVPRGSNAIDVTISGITFDGNRPNRTRLSDCTSAQSSSGSNVRFFGGTGFEFTGNRSTRTLCGMALQVDAIGFLVQGNLIDDNGHGREDLDAAAPWADGITLGFCEASLVQGNTVIDATDIAIVSFGGSDCEITGNHVEQISRHAFAGIGLHVPGPGHDAWHTGTRVVNNTVIGNGSMSFGISYGARPWWTTSTVHRGRIEGNTVSGAIVNLAVDGIRNGHVGLNSLSAPQGSPLCPSGGLSGAAPANYTSDDAVATTTLMVPVARDYDGCIP